MTDSAEARTRNASPIGIGAKRLEFLRQLVPSAKTVAVLVHADNPATEPLLRDLRAGAAVLGLQIIVSSVNSEHDFESAFAALAQKRPGALVVGADPLLTSRSAQIAGLAMRHRLPAIYTTADWVRNDTYRIAATAFDCTYDITERPKRR